jgi:large subunit ribosomal protein L14e
MIGQLCIKLSGKEAGKQCVIVDKLDNNYVLIDGNLKRRNCNMTHLELLDQKLEIKKGDSTESIRKAMEKAGIKVTIPRPKQKNEKQPVKKAAK